MGALYLFPQALSCLPRPHQSPSTHPLPVPIFCPKLTSVTLKPTRFSDSTLVRGSNSSDPNESVFLNKNGVVDDMDGYLNYLSLEYDSVWDTKPSWCQPWTIMLTGVLVIACSWLVFHSVVVTTLVLALISGWWYIFLYSYPKVLLTYSMILLFLSLADGALMCLLICKNFGRMGD